MLTGRALRDFEKWYYENEHNLVDFGNNEYQDIDTETFYHMKLMFTSGVILEWLRSVGVLVHNEPEFGDIAGFTGQWLVYVGSNYYGVEKDYNTALIEAIKQAVEIYNSTN